MKIAFFVPLFPILSETFILSQITGLIDRGHNVDIYAMKPGNRKKVHTDVDRYRLMERTVYLNNIPENYFLRVLKAICLIVSNDGWLQPTVLVRALNVLKYGRLAASLGLLYAAMQLVKQNQHDIIHCQFGNLGLNGLLLKQIGAVTGKLVTSFRGFDATKYIQNTPGIYNDLFREADLFLPVSQSIKQHLIQEGCATEKIMVLHSGIDCTKFQYTARLCSNDKTTNLLSIARLIEKKGVAYAIQAVARALRSGRHVTYAVVGDGALRLTLERLIQDLGVEAQVKLLGWKTHDEVIRLLQNAHLLIAPSVTAADGDQEGIPNVLKEAMAMGLPVLSTLHGGIPELVEDGVSGFLVPERDVDALTNRLTHLIDHPDLWREMGRHGRKCVQEHYDINKLNDRLVEIYQRLL